MVDWPTAVVISACALSAGAMIGAYFIQSAVRALPESERRELMRELIDEREKRKATPVTRKSPTLKAVAPTDTELYNRELVAGKPKDLDESDGGWGT
jgi:hypothetical protein